MRTQTLDRDGKGSFMKWGRWWLGGIRCEWGWHLQAKFGFRFEVGGGDSNREAQLTLHLPVLSVYPSIDLPRAVVEFVLPWRVHEWNGNKYKITSEREIQAEWHSGSWWWALWMSPNEWRSEDPRWRRSSFNPTDFLFGRAKYREGEGEAHQVEITMPEGSYAATVTLRDDSWKRPRWPWSRSMKRANIKPDQPIPVPGKGENAWDCGDDAIWEMTTPAMTVAEAVSALVASVNRDRLRYGGRKWRPSRES